MSDLLDQLLTESMASENDPHEAVRKVFEDALERTNTIAKCIPDDREDLAEEKAHWTIEWDRSLKPLWESLAAARKLGAEAAIDKPTLLDFKHLKATYTQWKEEAQLKATSVVAPQDPPVTTPNALPAVGLTKLTSASVVSSRREVSLITCPENKQDDVSTRPACNTAQDTTSNDKPDQSDIIQHDTPCNRCASAAMPCIGIPGRVCTRCKSISQRCSKLNGRGGTRSKRKREADGDGKVDDEQVPEALSSQGARVVQKRRVFSPPKNDADEIIEVLNNPPGASKGKQKAHLSKMPKLSKPTTTAAHNLTMQTKPCIVIPPLATPLSKPSIIAPPPAEKAKVMASVPKDYIKALGELKALALVTSAKVKHTQAKAKKAEGTLDVILSKLRSF